MSSSGFFDWRGRPASATALRRADLTDKIAVIFEASDSTYGYRRVHAQLARQGEVCGREFVRSLMLERGLVSCQPRPRVNLTKGDGREHHIPDLLEQDFTAPAPGQTMIGDITYVPTWEGWLYLATVIDVHTRMVIGYAMDDNSAPRSSALPCATPPTTSTSSPTQSSTPTAVAITPPESLRRQSPTSGCANRWAAPASATTMRWPSPSSRP